MLILFDIKVNLLVDILTKKINQLNMTIESIYLLNQQNINQLRDEFNETMQIMQQNIAVNDLTLKTINETLQFGPIHSE